MQTKLELLKPRIIRKRIHKRKYGYTKTRNFIRVDIGKLVLYFDRYWYNPFNTGGVFGTCKRKFTITTIVDDRGLTSIEHRVG